MAIKIVSNNKKAYFEYFIEDTFEAGISLTGSEVKSIRGDKVQIADSFVYIKNGEAFLKNANIVPYDKGSFYNPEARRDRKLLLHKREIKKLEEKSQQKGYSIVPTKLYFKGSLIKLEIGLARGKKLYDKRETIAQKDTERRTQREIREFLK